MPVTRVFVSHAAQDRLLASDLRGWFVDDGHDVFLDHDLRDGIAAGASSNLRVLGNTLSGNGEVGLLLFDLTGGLARDNRASGSPTGIVLYGGHAGVAGFAGKHGATNNQLVGNRAFENSGTGILVRGDGGKDVANDNLLSGNVASGNGRDGGIVIEGSAIGNRLRGNTAAPANAC